MLSEQENNYIVAVQNDVVKTENSGGFRAILNN